jgi:hypothetical protein
MKDPQTQKKHYRRRERINNRRGRSRGVAQPPVEEKLIEENT